VILGMLSTASTGAIFNERRTTYFTFDRAVQLPGALLPPGTYIFELATPNALDVVRVVSKDRKKVFSTSFTRLVERPRTGNDGPAIVFAERPVGRPPAIRIWYAAEDSSGREFVY